MSQIEEISKNEELSDDMMMHDDEITPEEKDLYFKMCTHLDLQNTKLVWNEKNTHATPKVNDQPIQFVARKAFMVFNAIPDTTINGRRNARILIKSNDKYLVIYFNILCHILRMKTRTEVGFIYLLKGLSNKTFDASIPLDNEERILIDVYDQDGVLINKAIEPSITIEELEKRFKNTRPCKASLKIQIDRISHFRDKYYTFFSISKIYLKPSISRM